ncbi:MAG: ATP-binding protein [Methyloligella sp. ZOD6]
MAHQQHSSREALPTQPRARLTSRLSTAFAAQIQNAPIVSIVAALLFGGLSIAAIATGTIGVLLFFAMMTGMALGAAFLIALQARELASAGRLNRFGEGIDASLESLQDLQWEVQEREARYRDLLNHQDDVILRRDPSGKLTFVNDTYCRVFGVTRQEALGQPFRLPLAGNKPDRTGEDAGRSQGPMPRRHSQVAELQTAHGPRWFIWEDLAITDESGALTEIQSVGHDVTEQRAAEQALAEARDNAESASTAKSRFLASMSHEIRTPMNGILGMTGLLLDTRLSPEQTTYAKAIGSSAKTLLSLIDEVLDFSKIEAGRVELHSAPFDIAEAMQSVIELLAPRAREKGLAVGWYADPALPRTVVGDGMRVRQILMNLVGNAIKFTDRGGVGLRLTRSEKDAESEALRLRFVVNDTGPGIPREKLDQIFMEFEQADSTLSRRHGGTGLGLAISKRLVDAMGGEIHVTSAPGEGTDFIVDLPLDAPGDSGAIAGDWPRLEDKSLLLVMQEPVEASLATDVLVAMGADVTQRHPEDLSALGPAGREALGGYDMLLTDRTSLDALPFDLLDAFGRRKSDDKRAVVVLDPGERPEIAALKARGFDGYLMRPIRPRSMLIQLAGDSAAEAMAAKQDVGFPPRWTSSAGAALNVLLAEDNDINALLARAVLEKAGARVTRAANGAEAIARAGEALGGNAEDRGFDLVLMDIHMPDMDGIEAAGRIRALYPERAKPGADRPPIVALTANAFAEDRAAYLEAGLDDYLAKPFEKNDLLTLIARWQVNGAGVDVLSPETASPPGAA